jgi:hypothetical protein
LALPAAAIIQATVSSFLHRHELIESELMADTGPGPFDPSSEYSTATPSTHGAQPRESWSERVSRRLERPRREGASNENRGWQGVEEDP